MKPNVFKYSVLNVGIVAAMGVTGVANAAGPAATTTAAVFDVVSQASATYTFDNTSQTATSNKVTVKVSETGSFTLLASTGAGDFNENLTINPQADETVDFIHTLKNTGNVADTYTINLSNGTSDDFDYNTANSTISYQIKNAEGTDVGGPTTIVSDGMGTIPLKAQEYAVITVTAKADTKRVIDANGILTVTATSTYLAGKSATETSATNTDNAKTTTPVYAITNSATTNLGNKNFDLQNDNAFVDYTITVKNEGNIDGTAVKIVDTLPDGLVAIQSGEANYMAPTSSSTVTPSISTDGKTITVEGQDITINDTITLTFRAKKDTAAVKTSKFATYVVISDSTKDNTVFDLVDSSDDTNQAGVVENNYETDIIGNLYKGKGVDANINSIIEASSQTRQLDISEGDSREVALLSDNIYTYTITNNGTDIDEATIADQTYFTIVPTTQNDKVTIGRVFVDTVSDGKYVPADDILLEKIDLTENYDLNVATVDGLTPTEDVTISVEVKTTGLGNNDGENDLRKFEVMTISVLPQGPIKSTPKPLDVATTSTTTMQGIDLQKFQATADCGTDVSTLTWDNKETTAAAGQCIFYKLDAKNTFTTANNDITNVIVTETLVDSVTYQDDFVSATDGTSDGAIESASGSPVTGTYATLIFQETGTITFSAKVSQTGAN
ncbi:DUF11 domain-containing protein [Psychrobacter sp. 72-O-c]|uniref:DUF11 domain-containing protein n=1 Tax=Psychrobacter sp. 72-O-c TaxID=2774125 RepID=UPI00191AF7D9|nr:DUF11 domain-containing protein [Psychrobacter sp. 72-O-c]